MIGFLRLAVFAAALASGYSQLSLMRDESIT